MSRALAFSEEEEEFLKDNWMIKTDEEIAHILGRSPRGIRDKRKQMGLIKRGGRPGIEDVKKAIKNSDNKKNLASLDKASRIEFFKENFTKNPRYTRLLKELDPDDLEFYKHKYVEFADSVDSLTIQEEDMLHHMIMADIHISRIRQQIRSAESQAEESKDFVFPMGLYQELKNAEDRLISYHKNLRVTREQRLSKEKEEKVTITSLIKAFQEKRAREEFGRQAGVMEFNAEMCKKDMDKFRFLLGG